EFRLSVTSGFYRMIDPLLLDRRTRMSDSRFALRVATLASCAVTFLLAACTSDTLTPTAVPGAASRDAGGTPNGGGRRNGKNGNAFAYGKVCAAPGAGDAACHSWIVVDKTGQPIANVTPAGYGPGQLQAAYNLATASANNGSGATVAIVDAFDDPNAES